MHKLKLKNILTYNTYVISIVLTYNYIIITFINYVRCIVVDNSQRYNQNALLIYIYITII